MENLGDRWITSPLSADICGFRYLSTSQIMRYDSTLPIPDIGRLLKRFLEVAMFMEKKPDCQPLNRNYCFIPNFHFNLSNYSAPFSG